MSDDGFDDGGFDADDDFDNSEDDYFMRVEELEELEDMQEDAAEFHDEAASDNALLEVEEAIEDQTAMFESAMRDVEGGGDNDSDWWEDDDPDSSPSGDGSDPRGWP